MSKLIDADALYNGAMKDEYFKFKESDKTGREAFAYSCAMQRLAEAPAVNQWISVKDRLPKEEDYRQCHENWDGAVIWTNGSDIGLGWYYTSTGNWADIYDCRIDDVTHWMPLPEPPKEDNNAEQ